MTKDFGVDLDTDTAQITVLDNIPRQVWANGIRIHTVTSGTSYQLKDGDKVLLSDKITLAVHLRNVLAQDILDDAVDYETLETYIGLHRPDTTNGGRDELKRHLQKWEQAWNESDYQDCKEHPQQAGTWLKTAAKITWAELWQFAFSSDADAATIIALSAKLPFSELNEQLKADKIMNIDGGRKKMEAFNFKDVLWQSEIFRSARCDGEYVTRGSRKTQNTGGQTVDGATV